MAEQTLTAERQCARISKLINDGLTLSGTGCFIAVVTHMATVGVKGHISIRPLGEGLICHHQHHHTIRSDVVQALGAAGTLLQNQKYHVRYQNVKQFRRTDKSSSQCRMMRLLALL